MLDRLTNSNWGEGAVDFNMDNNQVERQVNNLVGVAIFVNPNSVKEQMGKSSGGKEEIDDDLALLSTFKFLRNCRYFTSPR